MYKIHHTSLQFRARSRGAYIVEAKALKNPFTWVTICLPFLWAEARNRTKVVSKMCQLSALTASARRGGG